ncbi:MRN complex-interacting protein isoform X2 [Camelus ferus]|uniref:MRN complex-interacting protein isoform X2 n=1 Tax=Camelus ferus TaxID=419612 RepID=A0A8B8RU35_CAMFR|nr:MRN complex-interacting protein isoform X2 [Camelus ferus]
MAPPQQARVLRCCSCRLFQAHQVKKSLKWTCKACGEKQSFLRPLKGQEHGGDTQEGSGSDSRSAGGNLVSWPHLTERKTRKCSVVCFQAYSEGSGADCRRHVQKLNLLQGQISETSLRSLEESVSANEEESTGPGWAVHAGLQEKPQPSKNRWLKYLERDSEEPGPGGGACSNRQPSPETEKPEPPRRTGLPRKRKWSQSTVQPPCSPDVQDFRNRGVTLEPLKDCTGLAGKVEGGRSHEDRGIRELVVPWGEPPRPAQQVRATSSKWEPFLLPHVDVEPPTLLQRGPKPARAAQAEQGPPGAQTPREGGFSTTPGVQPPPQATHTPVPGPKGLCGKTPEQSWGTGPWAGGEPLGRGAQEPSLMRLCDLFKTGEDFDDDL